MKRIGTVLAIGAIAATGVLASTAAASGPAAPGKRLVEVTCEGLGTLTVSVAPSERAKGAGQVVGQKAHGIPVETTFSATDVNTNTLLFSETETRGGGHAHSNQSTISCESPPEEVEAALLFGEEGLPEGVSPSDIILIQFDVHVILKP